MLIIVTLHNNHPHPPHSPHSVDSVLLSYILPVRGRMLRIRSTRLHLSGNRLVVVVPNGSSICASSAVAVAADVHG